MFFCFSFCSRFFDSYLFIVNNYLHNGDCDIYEKRGERILDGYVISVVFASVLVALGGYISYGSASRTVKAATYIILLYVITTPIISLLSGFEDISLDGGFDFDDVVYDDESFSETACEAFTEGICALVASEYKLSGDDIAVYVFDFDFEKMRAGKIRIILSGRAVSADFRSIENFVAESGLGECEVKIDFG